MLLQCKKISCSVKSISQITACFDFVYLLTKIWDTLAARNIIPNGAVWYHICYPFIIYPLQHYALMATVYTVVVLSLERLHAICSPLTHEPYFWPYFLMILAYPFILIFPELFNFKLDYDEFGTIIGFSFGKPSKNDKNQL